MSDYYYLSSSLPLLLFHHGEPLIRYNDFLDDCRRVVSRSDYIQIDMARLTTGTFFKKSNYTFQKWQKTEFSIRNQLVKIRAKNSNRDPEPYLRSEYNESSFAESVNKLIDELTPLRAEIHLMEFQWKILDELEVGHLFDLDFLIVYSLKLQILERKMSFNTEKGKLRLFKILKTGEFTI